MESNWSGGHKTSQENFYCSSMSKFFISFLLSFSLSHTHAPTRTHTHARRKVNRLPIVNEGPEIFVDWKVGFNATSLLDCHNSIKRLPSLRFVLLWLPFLADLKDQNNHFCPKAVWSVGWQDTVFSSFFTEQEYVLSIAVFLTKYQKYFFRG